MSSSKLLPLYAQVAGRIADEIEAGQFAPGDRIYSIREICENFNVADVTAKKAITQLRSRGLVRTVNGSGAYVSEGTGPAGSGAAGVENRTVAFIKIGQHPAAIFAHEIDLLQRELARLDHSMIYAIARNGDELEVIVKQMGRVRPCCLLVFPPHNKDHDVAADLARLRECNVPMLILESRLARGSYITTDTERATLELAQYLYDLGHRRFCLATTFSRKVAGFEAALQRWRDDSVQHTIVGETGKTDSDSRDLAQQILAMDPRPTAVIAADDHAAAIMISTFIQLGVSVPEDISVVTYGDHPQSSPLSPVPLTVMRHPFLEIAQEAANWSHDQLKPQARGRTVKREMTGTLIMRDSSGPPSA